MARQRDSRRDEAFQIWKKHNGKITNRAIAEKLDVPEKTVGGWKSKDKWNGDSNGVLQKEIRSTPNRKPVITSEGLSDKQQQFCLYYIRHFNATKAYQLAYECSYSVANAEGYKLLVKPRVKEEIRRLKADMQSELFLDAADIAREYLKMAFADITDFLAFGTREVQEYDREGAPLMDVDGNPEMRTVSFVEFKDYKEVDGTMIQEIKQGRDGVSIKLYDKQKALQELDKRLLTMDELKVQKLQAEIDKLHREGSPDTSTEDKLKDYFTALGGAFRDN